MPPNRRISITAILIFCVTPLLLSCVGIDHTSLWDQPFYLKTKESLEKIPPKADLPKPLMAGTGRIDITPPVGTPLGGYGNRMGRGSTGTHDRLYARALALSNGDQTVILLANDLLAITDDIYGAVYKKISQKISIEPDALMISASHTHSGPGALAKKFWESFATGPFDPVFFDETTQRMADAALRAYHRMSPAQWGGGTIQVPELIQNRINARGPIDPTLSFLIFKVLDRSEKIYVMNYSAHATVLKDNNYLFSGDYPGALERRLEQESGVTALFTAGAVADLTARPPAGRDDFDRAQKMGNHLADLVQEASTSVRYEARAQLGAISASIQLPPTQIKVTQARRLASPLGNLFFDGESVIQAIRIGDYVLLGVPCDLSSQIALEIKQRAAQQDLQAIIVGFANDYIGYVIPEKYYDMDAYESRMSFNGPHMDTYLKQVISQLIEKITGQPKRRGDN